MVDTLILACSGALSKKTWVSYGALSQRHTFAACSKPRFWVGHALWTIVVSRNEYNGGYGLERWSGNGREMEWNGMDMYRESSKVCAAHHRPLYPMGHEAGKKSHEANSSLTPQVLCLVLLTDLTLGTLSRCSWTEYQQEDIQIRSKECYLPTLLRMSLLRSRNPLERAGTCIWSMQTLRAVRMSVSTMLPRVHEAIWRLYRCAALPMPKPAWKT